MNYLVVVVVVVVIVAVDMTITAEQSSIKLQAFSARGNNGRKQSGLRDCLDTSPLGTHQCAAAAWLADAICNADLHQYQVPVPIPAQPSAHANGTSTTGILYRYSEDVAANATQPLITTQGKESNKQPACHDGLQILGSPTVYTAAREGRRLHDSRHPTTTSGKGGLPGLVN